MPLRRRRADCAPLGGHDARHAALHHTLRSAHKHARQSRTRWRVRHRELGAQQVQASHQGPSRRPPCSSQGWERAAASTPPCCAATRSSRFQMHSRPTPKCLRSEECAIAAPELRESSAACSGASTLRTSTLNSGRPLRPSPRPHWPASQARSEQRAGGSLSMARPRPRTHLRTRPFALEGGWVGK